MTAQPDNLKHVNRGDNVVEHLTAERFNAYTDAANWFKRVNTDDERKFSEIKDRPSLVDIRAVAATERMNVVGLDSIGIPFANRNETLKDIFRPDFTAATPAAIHQGKFALAIEDAIQANDVFSAVAHGVYACKLFVPANGGKIERADIDPSDATRLLSTPNGSAQILWKDAGTDTTVDAIVRLGNQEYVEVAGKLDNPGSLPATPGSSTNRVMVWGLGVSTGYHINDVHLDWMTGNENISHDKEVLVGWFPAEKRWRFVGAECEDGGAGPPYVTKWNGEYRG